MVRTLLLELVVLVALLVIAGCAAPGNQGSGGASLTSLLGEWTLRGVEGEGMAVPAGARTPTLNINDEGRVSGVAGINRISGALDAPAIARGEFRLGPVAATRMAGSPEAMAFEDRYLDLLKRVAGFEVSGDTLRLLDAGKRELLRFARGT